MGLRKRENTIEEDLILGTQGLRPQEQRRGIVDRLPEELFQRPRDIGLPSTNFREDPNALPDTTQFIDRPERINLQLPPREEFRQQIGTQIGQAQERFEEGARERGAFTEGLGRRQFEAGIRVGGIVVAQKEFKNALLAERDAVEQLARASGITNAVRLAQFKEEQHRKLQIARQSIVKLANETALKLEKAKVSREKKAKTRKLMTTIATAIIVAAII